VSSERAGEDMIWPASKNKAAAFASCSLGLLCACLCLFGHLCFFPVQLFSFLLSLGVPTLSLNTLCFSDKLFSFLLSLGVPTLSLNTLCFSDKRTRHAKGYACVVIVTAIMLHQISNSIRGN
jgi:hypothetical protein